MGWGALSKDSAPLHLKEWSEEVHLIRTTPFRCFQSVPLGRDSRADPDLTGGAMYRLWTRHAFKTSPGGGGNGGFGFSPEPQLQINGRRWNVQVADALLLLKIKKLHICGPIWIGKGAKYFWKLPRKLIWGHTGNFTWEICRLTGDLRSSQTNYIISEDKTETFYL